MTFLLLLGTTVLILVLVYRRPAVCCLMLALVFGLFGVYCRVQGPFNSGDYGFCAQRLWLVGRE